MTKVYKLYNINYDTDGNDVELPAEALVMVNQDSDIAEIGADLISDNTGYCVNSFSFKPVKTYPKSMDVGSFLVKK